MDRLNSHKGCELEVRIKESSVYRGRVGLEWGEVEYEVESGETDYSYQAEIEVYCPEHDCVITDCFRLTVVDPWER